MTEQTPQYKPGDVANGHILSNDGQWIPMPGAVPSAPAKQSHKVRNIVLGGVGALVLIGIISAAAGGSEEKEPAASKPAASSTPAEDEAKDEAKDEPEAEEPSEEPAEEPAEEVVEDEAPAITLAQENAIGSAEDYLDYSAFSRTGLIEQLSSEYGEGFTKAQAVFAVNHIDVDWKAQAAKSAQDYLDYSSFSRQGLIEQLSSEYGEGFTKAQAIYGVNKAGL